MVDNITITTARFCATTSISGSWWTISLIWRVFRRVTMKEQLSVTSSTPTATPPFSLRRHNAGELCNENEKKIHSVHFFKNMSNLLQCIVLAVVNFISATFCRLHYVNNNKKPSIALQRHQDISPALLDMTWRSPMHRHWGKYLSCNKQYMY